MTNEEVVKLQMEYDAMRVCRAEDHRTCEALRRSLTENQDKLRAEVDRSTFLRTRLDAANADVQRLSAMVEELRERAISKGDDPAELTYCMTCGVAWDAHRDDECEKRKAQDANRAATVRP